MRGFLAFTIVAVGFVVALVAQLALYVGSIALVVWIVVKVLQAMGVL